MNLFRLALIVGALPSTLVNGTTADATQVMADLNWIVNQVNANAAPLATTALTNANNNFTTVQSGQAATQPANFPIASQIENNSLQTLSSVLGTNTITARVSAIPLPAYVSGQVFTFFPSNANTGAATVNIDGLGARSVLNMGSNLSGAELQTYRPSVLAFDGTLNAFDLVNGTPYVQGPNIPSAATLNLDGAFGDYNQVDGTAPITALTLSRGRQKLLEFTSSPLLSHSASLVLGSNITPNAGDVFAFRGETGLVRLVGLFRQNTLAKKQTRTVQTTGSGLYVPPVGCTYYDVEMVGGGGQGGQAGTATGNNGGATTFGAVSAGGGVGGSLGGTGGAGGASSGGDANVSGGSGGAGIGGQGFFGGGALLLGGVGATNSGGGGAAITTGGGGGGAGGYAKKLFVPAQPQAFSVGAGGSGSGTGSAGGSGIIIIDEYYA